MAKSSNFIPGDKSLDIVIVGGSCAGLFAGILLRNQGHRVRILESSQSSERQGLAAGIGLAANVQKFFAENDRLKDIPIGTPSEFMNIMDQNLKPEQKVPLGYGTTSWDAIYYRLRANFDAYKSSYCENPPKLEFSAATAVFEVGVRVLRVDEHNDGKLQIAAENIATGEAKSYDADIVVAADGANSVLRRQVQPDISRAEPGYMIWRGTVPTKELPQEVVNKFESNVNACPMASKDSYLVIYTIPGNNGSLVDGERFINVVWYSWPSKHSPAEILTDVDGHTHRTTLPKDKMRPEIWDAQVNRFAKDMHPDLALLVKNIKEPFASVVSSIIMPKSTYLNNRLFLIGDALAQVQPNLGQGTNLAATAAMGLVDVLSGRIGVDDFNDSIVTMAKEKNEGAIALGRRFLYGGTEQHTNGRA